MKKNLIFYSLSFRITLGILLLIIPINIATIMMSNQMIKSIEEDLIESYKNELAIYMTRIDDDIVKIREGMNKIIKDNWYSLSETYDGGKANIAKYEFWQRLGEIREDTTIVEIAYVKTNWDQDVRINYDPNNLSYSESQKIVDYLKEVCLDDYHLSNFETITIEGKNYLLNNITLYNYSFGVLIDIDKMLEPLESLRVLSNEVIFFSNNQGESIGSQCIFSIDSDSSLQKLTIDGKDEFYTVIIHPSTQIDYSLVRLLPEAERKSATPSTKRVFQLISFYGFIIIPLLLMWIHRLVLKPLKVLDEAMRQIEGENLQYQIEENVKTKEFKHLYKVFNSMTKQINDLKIESYEKDIENLEIETTNLRLQMNPHMLLNSLNMIYSLAQSKNHEYVKKFSLHLVQYFRYTLKKNELLVPVKQEIDFIRNYLEIQKIRFPNTFTCVYDVDESLYDKRIPPLMIQSFIENSIKYGLKMGSEIEILIVIRTNGEYMTLAICDTGNGIPSDVLRQLKEGNYIENNTGTHIGIWNCRRRLKMIYGEKASMTITSTINEGTQVWIELPIRDDNNK